MRGERGSLVHTITDSSTAEYSSVLDYRDVCIAYHTGTSRRGRQQPKAGAGKARWPQSQQLISLRHAGGDPATALSVLMGFSEYTLNYHELLVTRRRIEYRDTHDSRVSPFVFTTW